MEVKEVDRIPWSTESWDLVGFIGIKRSITQMEEKEIMGRGWYVESGVFPGGPKER